MPSPHAAIYQRLIDFCEPASLSEWLASTTIVQGARRGTANPFGLLRTLQHEFTAAQLQGAGVLRRTRGNDSRYQLHPDLFATEKSWLALYDKEGQPIDLLLSSGSVQHRELALLGSIRDAGFRKALGEMKELFFAFAVEDVIALRSMGLAATLATGLEHLRQPWLGEFVKILDWETNTGLRSRPPSAQLVNLVGWSPARMVPTAPDGLPGVLDHLRNLRQSCRTPVDNICVWEADPGYLRSLQFIFETETPKRATELLRESIPDHSSALIAPPQPTLADFYKEFVTECHIHNNWTKIVDAMGRYKERLFECTIRPRLVAVERASNPEGRSILLQLANLYDEFYDFLARRLIRRFQAKSSYGNANFNDELRQLERYINASLKLEKRLANV